MQELVTLVDTFGAPIGELAKSEVHRSDGETPLHLGFSLFVVNSLGQHLLQRRADTKTVWPSVWSNACCGHPMPGESLPRAAQRRMQYELGASLEANSIQVLVNYYRYSTVQAGIQEHEVCPILFARYDGELAPNPQEVAGTRWVSLENLQTELKETAHVFSPWMREELEILMQLRHPAFVRPNA